LAVSLITDTEALIAEHWFGAQTLRGWWAKCADAGLAFPDWPVGSGGRGATVGDAIAVARVMAAAGVIGPPPGLGSLMGGPVVREFGRDEQQSRLLRPLADGTEGWCQLFSEPGAGSDLAGLRTRADQDGHEWVINGQKVWTSGADDSRRAMLVARSNWDAPKHRGLTYFIVDLDQPGVEIRPLKQMNGRSHFSEVFLTDVRVSDDDRIGDVNGGWAVTVATLGYERRGLASEKAHGLYRAHPGELTGQLDRTVGEIVADAQARGEGEDEAAPGKFDSLVGLAGDAGRSSDPVIRQELAAAFTREQIAGWSAQRARLGAPTGALAKLQWTNGLRRSSQLGLELLGAHAMLREHDSNIGGRFVQFALSVPSASIAGGSDEIQRNIIAEKVLGLPKDISVDTDVAFRDVRKSG
jgi:alkylation response protein AidB-like acyl-CoA dehydrogenase